MLKKQAAYLLCSALMLAGLIGCKQDGPLLSILGLDSKDNEIKMKISEEDFGTQFSDVLNTASVSSMETLDEEQARSQWGLDEVEVGIDLQLSGGITSVVNLGVGSGAALTISREGARHE